MNNNKCDLTFCPYLLKYLQLYFDRCDNFHILQADDLFMKSGFGPNDLDGMFMLIRFIYFIGRSNN